MKKKLKGRLAMETDKFPKYSEMEFVSTDAFPMDESRAYANLGKGIRSVEFARIIDDKLFFVEAKSTIAHPDNSPELFDAEIFKISEKFIHSLNLLSAIEFGVVEEAMPAVFRAMEITSLVFCVVVRNHQPDWCRGVKRRLEEVLPLYIRKIWKPTLCVINYETAKKQQLAV
jgi:hypothetical protein